MANKNSRRSAFPGEKSFIVKGGRNRYSSADASSDQGTKTDLDGGPVKDPPALPTDMPTFPDFSSMTCEQLDAAIRSYKAWLSLPTFAPNNPAVVQAYNDAITKASIIYNSKGCATGSGGGGGNGNPPKLDPIVIVPTSVTDHAAAAASTVPGASGGIPGGGGGDGGSSPAAKKNKFPWLWVIGGAAVLYFFFGGKKSSGSSS
jgi:hypothetical protein